MRAGLHILAACLLGLMAISHGLGTPDAIVELGNSRLEPSLARAFTVLWVNGALLPAVLAAVLLSTLVRPRGRGALVWLVAAVTALQAVGAAYVAGPTFFGVWVIASAAVAVVLGEVWPDRSNP